MAHSYITNFIHSLNKIEIQRVEEYLKSSASSTPEFQKNLKLFKLLVLNPEGEISNNKLCKALNCSTGALNVLKSRLYHKIMEALTSDKHITNADIFDELDIVSFSLKKKLLFFKISLRSLTQAKTEALDKLLNEIIDTAKKYELYDVLTDALKSKKYFRGNRFGIKEFETINNEIHFYNYCLQASLNANDHYFRLIINTAFTKSFSKKELGKYIDCCIMEMENDYKKTKAQQINYYLHIMYFAKCEREKKYIEAIEYCNKLVVLLKKNKAIYRKERIGFILSNISLFNVHIGNYKAATIDAKKAQTYFKKNSFDIVITREQEFHSYFYNKNYIHAKKCLTFLLDHSPNIIGKFRRAKYVYYKSCVLFASGNYKEALDLLKMSLEIEQDKTRWNISLRILNIMIFIELNRIDDANRALESLRKHVERQAKAEEVKARDVLIVKVLRELEKDNFEYSSKNAVVVKALKELSEKDTSVSWEHYSTELAPFHKWLEGRKEL